MPECELAEVASKQLRESWALPHACVWVISPNPHWPDRLGCSKHILRHKGLKSGLQYQKVSLWRVRGGMYGCVRACDSRF